MQKPVNIHNYLDNHYIHRSNWLRAAVLGANDGIISVASLAIGIASANSGAAAITLATAAACVAGALSMAAGEYVSVSSQRDIEKADIAREAAELAAMPQEELALLSALYQARGLSASTAKLVAEELSAQDALSAHVRDELGINPANTAKPLQAALASALAFLAGGLLPLLVVLLVPIGNLKVALYVCSVGALMLLGALSAKLGGANCAKAMWRILIWGTLALLISAALGYVLG